MSDFHSESFYTPMVFGVGNWDMDVEHDEDARTAAARSV